MYEKEHLPDIGGKGEHAPDIHAGVSELHRGISMRR
jgi:hypothetical protein